jgi:hypothetical protein
MQVLADRDSERTEQNPGHEAEIEIQERREQGRQMAGLEETLMHLLVTLIRGIAIDPSGPDRKRSYRSGLPDPIVVDGVRWRPL